MHGPPPPPPPRPRDPRRLARLEQNANAAADNPAIQAELYKVISSSSIHCAASWHPLIYNTRNCEWQGDQIR